MSSPLFQNKRKILFIKKQFQTDFIIRFCLVVLFSSLLFGALLFFSCGDTTTLIFKNLRIRTIPTREFLFPSMALGFIASLILASIMTIIVMLSASNRIGGPMYRFEITLNRLGEGDFNQFVALRDYDQLKDIGEAMTNALASLRSKMTQVEEQVTQLEDEMKKQGFSSRKLQEVKKAIALFRYR